MKQNKKILLTMGLTLTALGAVLLYAFSSIMMHAFDRFEHEDVVENTRRVKDTLFSELDDLLTKSSDWSVWDDTYEFMMDHNPRYIESNLDGPSLENLKINLILYLDNKGNIVEKKAVDLDLAEEVDFPDELVSTLVGRHFYFELGDEKKILSGFLQLPKGIMMVAIRPILKSDASGPVNGTIIFGKYLTEEMITETGQRLHLNYEAQHYEVALLKDDYSRALKKMTSPSDTFVFLENDETALGFIVISDLIEKPMLVLKVNLTRDIHKLGVKILRILAGSLIVHGLVLWAVGSVLSKKFFKNENVTVSTVEGASRPD